MDDSQPTRVRSSSHSQRSHLPSDVSYSQYSVNDEALQDPLLASHAKLEPITKKTFMRELKEMGRLAFPLCVTYLLQQSMGLVDLMFVGHLGKEYLEGAALANMWANVSGFSVLFGVATALDTLASQAYGAGNYGLLGVQLQKGTLVLTACCIPVLVAWLMCERIMKALDQDPKVSEISQEFMDYLIIGLWPAAAFEALRKYIQAQRVVAPTLWVLLLTNIINVAANYVFIHVLDMGFKGSPLATSFSRWMMLFLLAAYIVYHKIHVKTWTGFTKNAFKGWLQFFRLGIPGALMLMCEWIAFEVGTLFAGTMNGTALSTQTIAMSLVAYCFMIPLGISIAASVRVGNALGSNDASAARLTTVVSMTTGFSAMLLTGTLMFSLKNELGKIWSSDQDVVDLVAHVAPVIAAFGMLDGTQGVASGVLRGCGRQTIGAVLNFVAFYVIGIPVGYVLAFPCDEGVRGLWEGISAGLLVQTSVLIFLLARTKWQDQCDNAYERLKEEDESTEDSNEESQEKPEGKEHEIRSGLLAVADEK